MITVFENVQIQVKYGQAKSKNVYQLALNIRNTHIKTRDANQDVTQVKYGKIKSVYLNAQKLTTILT